ncbi:MAG TPA: Ig-like domain-containing protein, partial [Anaerolineae bacterium]|nr:Ig-like domain-containing protein [Anaerolineae bacterium]
MQPLAQRRVLSLLFVLVVVLSIVPLTAAAPQAAISLSSAYSQDFNTLAASGTANAWTDDSTLAGWYSTQIQYIASSGTSTTGGLYSFGLTSSSERALGSLGSNATGAIYYGARFVNNTGQAVTALTVNYFGEQWRNGGNTNQHKLTVDYQIGSSVTSLTGGTWTPVSALDFTGPIASSTAAALDGNAAANRVALSHTFNVAINAGQEIMLRWTDLNDSGNDHGLAIDDLTVTATTSSADTPPTVTSTTPTNNAQNVALNTTITVNFSDNGPDGVDVAAGAFTVQCPVGTPVAFSSAPALPADNITSVVLTPNSPLPPATTCTVTVLASQVTDNDGAADPMAANFVFTFTTIDPSVCSLAFTPIYSIQGSGPSAAITGAVTTQGVVVGDFEGPSPALRGFYMQDLNGDSNAATSDGIFVFNGDNNSVSLGDVVRVTGTAAEFQDQTQISSVTALLPCGAGNVTPLDISLPFAAADYPERYEGMLVRLPQTLYVSEHFQLGRFGQVVLTARSDRLQQPTNVVAPGAPALDLQADNNLNRIIVDDAQNSQNPDP